MSAQHPTPWTIEDGDNGKRGKLRREWANILDAREVYVVDGMDSAATAREIVDAVNGKTEADAPIPLPFDMAKARDEASRRYQETHQEFWAGLADLLADAAALEEYHANDRAEILRLRAFINELCDCLEEEDAEAYRMLISRAKEAAQ